MAHDPPPAPEELSVTMLLADAAQVADGKLSILGGGIAVVAPTPQPLALAFVVQVPWSRADETFPWVCELLDAERMPVMAGDVPILVNGQVAAGRPAGVARAAAAQRPRGDQLQRPAPHPGRRVHVAPRHRRGLRRALDGGLLGHPGAAGHLGPTSPRPAIGAGELGYARHRCSTG